MSLLRPSERDLTVDGRRLHLLDWGGDRRPPLLLLHGFTGHAHAWDTLAIALQPHFHVMALDARGHGDSDPADVYDSAGSFRDLSSVVEQLGLRARDDGRLVWKWHPSIKERRVMGDVDWWAIVREIKPPLLLLRGAESTVLDADVAERMARELPRGTLVEIPRAVHTLHEDNPEAVLDALRAFLKF